LHLPIDGVIFCSRLSEMHQNALFRDLGRLEGRLHRSPSRLSWLLAMRIRGVVFSAENAGVPVNSDDVRQWFSGKQLTPRHLEGLNDPISVATVAHYYLQSLSDIHDPENTIACAKLSAVCDHQKWAMEWSPDEYRIYEKLGKAVTKSTSKLEIGTSVSRVANGCVKALRLVDQLSRKISAGQSQPIALELVRSTPIAWMVAMRIPYLLVRAGIVGCSMPSLIPSLRFTDLASDRVERAILARMATEVSFGLKELDRLEKERALLNEHPAFTKRSRIYAAADIMQALPRIGSKPLARTLGITPQGAGYLITQMRELTRKGADFAGQYRQPLL
jgi:hypothetical protein